MYIMACGKRFCIIGWKSVCIQSETLRNVPVHTDVIEYAYQDCEYVMRTVNSTYAPVGWLTFMIDAHI